MTSTCPCCGQTTAATVSATIWVEEDVLALCNRAYEVADAGGAAEVELRHLIEAMEQTAGAAALVARYGCDLAAVLDEARRMRLGGIAGTGERPRTSDALRTLLERAKRQAVGRGMPSVSLELIVATLMTDMRDVAAAAFVPKAIAAQRSRSLVIAGGVSRDVVLAPGHASTNARDTHARERDASQGLDLAGFNALARCSEQSTKHVDPAPSVTSVRDRDYEQLMARFQAQERMLNLLQRQLETISSELGVSTRSHRRFFRKRRSSSSLSRFFRRRMKTNGSGSGRGDRTARAQARASELQPLAAFVDADAPEADLDTDLDDTTPLEARPKRFYLALEDDVVRAPSIGPRTATKLTAVGVALVRDLLLAEPGELAAALQSRYITPQRIVAWQAQARLVCTIPWLRGTHAQMLVGAGYDTVKKVQGADRDALCAAVLQFAETRDGQSVLRSSPPPESERIMRWADFAAMAEYDRAATHAYTH